MTTEKTGFSWLLLLCTGIIAGCVLFFVLMWLREHFKPENDADVFRQAVKTTAPFILETQSLLTNGQPVPAFYQENLSSEVTKLERFVGGDIIFYTANKQMMWLHPQTNEQGITWVCFGSPARLVQSHCPSSP